MLGYRSSCSHPITGEEPDDPTTRHPGLAAHTRTRTTVPTAPTPALTPIWKSPTAVNWKPSSSISAKFPAFSASNASTSPASDMATAHNSPRAKFTTAEYSLFPFAVRPVLATCPFAGYLARHTLESSPLPPIQWKHAVQAHASRCVRPLPHERVPPASVHGLSSARPGRDVVQQRRATQNFEHFGSGSHATRKVETSRDR